MSMLSHIRREQTFIWSDRLSLPFESAFGRLQKYAWANLMDARQIGQSIFGTGGLPARQHQWELFRGAWIQAPPARPQGLNFLGGFAVCHWMSLLCRTDVLRFCPKCLDDGYHSLYHQVEALALCPRHLEPLRLSCSHCKSRVLLALCKDSFSHPFCCPKCQQPLSGQLAADRWPITSELVSSIVRAFEPIDLWMAQLSRYRIEGEMAPLAQLSMAGEFTGELNTVVAFGIANHFVPLQASPSLLRTSRRPLHVVELANHTDDSEVGNFAVHGIEMDAFEKVANDIRKDVLQGHRECREKSRRGILLREDFRREVTQQEPGLCPISAGYARWHARTWLHAEQDRKHYRQFNCKVPLPTEFTPQRLLAQFYSSVATAYVCELFHREGYCLETTVNSPLHELLDRYSTGTQDRNAYWLVTGPAGEAPRKWIVMGEPSFMGPMHQLHNESLLKESEFRPFAAVSPEDEPFRLSI